MSVEETQKEEYIIDTKAVQNSFEQELKQYGDSSARIFFSGKYGVGKTKFLERFFKEKKEEYLTVHLYPVNYQIYNNLDIIELLKVDIIIELLKQNILFADNSKLTLVEYLKQYATPSLIAEKIVNYGTDISKTISSAIPGNPLYSIPIGVFSILGRALKDYQTVNSHFHDIKSGDSGTIEKYIEKSKEPDIISSIVHTTIKDINDKKSVLIIDDLDRLDPEHVFRILNILSAHFDQGREREGDNKFGFDYIIIVGDYHNIQKIFHHKYGEKIDFDGYIDKFYTIKPFEFDNRKALLNELDIIIEKYQRDDLSKDFSTYMYILLEDILRNSINIKAINLRELLKNINLKSLTTVQKYSNIPRESAHIIIVVDILIDIFGTKEKLIQVIEEIKIYNPLSMALSHQAIVAELSQIVIGNTLKNDEMYLYKDYKLILSNGLMTIKGSNSELDYMNLYYDLLLDYISQEMYKVS
jgi:GTPase SAR1 family protein